MYRYILFTGKQRNKRKYCKERSENLNIFIEKLSISQNNFEKHCSCGNCLHLLSNLFILSFSFLLYSTIKYVSSFKTDLILKATVSRFSK